MNEEIEKLGMGDVVKTKIPLNMLSSYDLVR